MTRRIIINAMAAALACASCVDSGSDEPHLRTYAGSDDAVVYC